MKNNIAKTFKSKLIFGRYNIKYLIAKGAFGEVYLGTNILDNKQYALKIEKANKGESMLKKEAYTLLLLKGPGLPSVITFGLSGRYHILVENLLGKSIYNIWLENNKKFNLKDTCMFAIQALERIKYVHSKNYLHRDIKPANFLVGNPDKSQIFLIDFGNARKYRSSRTGKHLSFNKNNRIYGTPQFLSLNALKGIEPSRKDELESLGLVIIYLYQGFLPWSNLKPKNLEQAIISLRELREKISIEELCKNLPKEIYEYLNYVKNMNSENNPNYKYLQSLFMNILKIIGETNDLIFSWVDKKIVPQKIISRNSKSLKKLYINILSANSLKMKLNSNIDLYDIKDLSGEFLHKNIKRNNSVGLNKIKGNTFCEDNQINFIYKDSDNNNSMKEKENKNINRINFDNVKDKKDIIALNNKPTKKNNIFIRFVF